MERSGADIALDVSASVVLLFSIGRIAWHLPPWITALWKWFFRSKNRRDGHLFELICEQKIAVSWKFAWYVQSLVTLWAGYFVANDLLAHRETLMSPLGQWLVVFFLAALLLTFNFECATAIGPQVSLDLGYVGCQLFVAMVLFPWAWTSSPPALVVSSMGFVLISLPAVAFVRHSCIVLLCETAMCGLKSSRAFMDPASVGNPVLLLLFSLCHVPIALLVFQLIDTLMLQEAEAKVLEGDSRIQMNAASSLLELTCDAVLELDSELRLVKDNPNLTAMLLLRPGSLETRSFTDFLPSTEQERATELLQQPGAHAFHTRLVDSYSNKFRTEVFQVKYTRMNGQTCHLLGLRDFTDQNPLAAPGGGPVTGGHRGAPGALDGASGRGDAVSINSWDLAPVSEDSMGRSSSFGRSSSLGRPWPGAAHGIVEQRAKPSQKEAFLEIHVDQQVVAAASAPFSYLSGMPVTDVFATDSTCLLQRLCDTARRCVDGGELPDQVVSFHKMPMYVSDVRVVEASGVMKACFSNGQLLVLMCFVSDGAKWRGEICGSCRLCPRWSL